MSDPDSIEIIPKSSQSEVLTEKERIPFVPFDPRSGEYLTYQCNILEIILSYFSEEELINAKLVSKEWRRLVHNTLVTRNFLRSTVYLNTEKFDLSKVKFRTDKFSICFAHSSIVKKVSKLRTLNLHLINEKEYQSFRVFDGNYLPPLLIGMCGDAYDFVHRTQFQKSALAMNAIQGNSVNITIIQLQITLNNTKLKTELEKLNSSHGPVVSMIVFSSYKILQKEPVTVFRQILQSVQKEPFVLGGITANWTLLLPSGIRSSYDFDVSVVVFRGDKLKVTADIFKWTHLNDTEIDQFKEFVIKLLKQAGTTPPNCTRIVYIFECYCVKKELLKNLETILNQLTEGVELVFIRSRHNEFYFNSLDNDNDMFTLNADLKTYSTIICFYDFYNISKKVESFFNVEND